MVLLQIKLLIQWTLKVFTITHDRNSADLVVSVRETASGEIVFVDTVVTTTDVTLTFVTAPTTDAYTVTIIG